MCAPASTEDVDDLEKLATLLELNGLWVGETTLKDVFRGGGGRGRGQGIRWWYHVGLEPGVKGSRVLLGKSGPPMPTVWEQTYIRWVQSGS